MTQLALFTEQVGTYPYPSPCPIREECGAYQLYQETRCGCGGRHGWCGRAQRAAGRWESEMQHWLRTGRR